MQRGQNTRMSLSGAKNLLQKLGPAIIVVFGLGASIFVFSRFFTDSLSIWIVAPLLVAGFLVFGFLATALSRGKGSRGQDGG